MNSLKELKTPKVPNIFGKGKNKEEVEKKETDGKREEEEKLLKKEEKEEKEGEETGETAEETETDKEGTKCKGYSILKTIRYCKCVFHKH